MKDKFPQRLNELRQDLGVSQQELAKQFNVSQNAVYKWENGLSEPSSEVQINLAKFFNTTIEYLLGESDINPKGAKYYILIGGQIINLEVEIDDLTTALKILSLPNWQMNTEYNLNEMTIGEKIDLANDIRKLALVSQQYRS